MQVRFTVNSCNGINYNRTSPGAPDIRPYWPVPADTVSFGSAKKVTVPYKDVDELFKSAAKSLEQTPDLTQKALIIQQTHESLGKIIKDWFISVNPDYTKEQVMMFTDMDHEIDTPAKLLQKYFLAFTTKDEQYRQYYSEFLPLNLDEGCLDRFNEIRAVLKKYQFFFNCGLEKTTMTPDKLFRLAVNPVIKGAKKKNIEITINNEEILKNPGISIYTENYKIYTIFANILNNALKYTPCGGKINIDLDINTLAEGVGVINFKVTDTGIGINPEEIEKVIEGGRTEKAVKSGIPGTGKGLKRAAKIILFQFSRPSICVKSPVDPENTQYPGTMVSCPVIVKIIQ